jgi:hypothetical protein
LTNWKLAEQTKEKQKQANMQQGGVLSYLANENQL